MIDIHHHLLPGLDDGSPDIATSIAMARMAAEDGITHIVCTPHASSRYTYSRELVTSLAEELRAALASEKIPVQIAAGCDFHLSYDNIEDSLVHPRRYTIGDGPYVMVELPDRNLTPGVSDTYYRLKVAGMTPVLTHPERNITLQGNPKRLADWLQRGLLVQVTTGSVMGTMGKTAERLAHKMLEDRWVHFLATDAHNLDRRPPKMRAAHDLVAERYGAEYAHRLCVENPLAVFEGRPLGPQEEPLNIPNDFGHGKTTWWKRLFGKY